MLASQSRAKSCQTRVARKGAATDDKDTREIEKERERERKKERTREGIVIISYQYN
jgi:hypothetical protein